MPASPQTISSLSAFPNTSFNGTEEIPIISRSSSVAPWVNYNITSQLLALYLQAALIIPTILEDEATYASINTDTRILVNNSMAFTTAITLLAAASYGAPVLVKDVGGFASQANPITVLFSSGELVDGLSQVDIVTPYGAYWFNPLTQLTPNRFYLGTG